MIIALYQYGSPAAGLLLAIGAWVLAKRSVVRLPNSARISAAIGMALALALLVAFRAWGVFPPWLPPLGEDGFLVIQLASFIAPLLLTALLLLFLIFPIPAPGPRGSAALAPRMPWSFVPRRWAGLGIGVVVAVVGVAVLAGLASITDEAGRHVMYEVPASESTRGGTSIYGWWFSVPCLIAVGVVVVIVFAGLALQSRPALGSDAERDVAIRTARARNILAVAVGGLLLHLGTVLNSLYGTSSMRLGFAAGPAGFVELGTPFAAIGPALQIAAWTVAIVGFALWWFTLLSVVAVRERRHTVPVPA